MTYELKIGDAAEFRMYAKQLQMFDKVLPADVLKQALNKGLKGSLPQQYIEIFKMCCDVEFVEALGDAGVSYCHERGKL